MHGKQHYAHIILDRKKEFYYRGLDKYDDEPGFLIDTFRSFQDAYYTKYAKYVPLMIGS